MDLVGFQRILERMEKKIEGIREEMEFIREENQEIMQKLGIRRKDDLPKSEELKGLTRLSMESILSYMEPSKRLWLSIFYPKIRPIEKGVPLVVEYLHLSTTKIAILKFHFQFHEDKKICRLVLEKDSNPAGFVSVAEFEDGPCKQKCISVAFSKLIFDLFTGRKHFEVAFFVTNILFPFEINIKVGKALVEPGKLLFARNYSNITGTIEKVFFIGLDRPEDLGLAWVRNVDRMESIGGNCDLFSDELPNITAKTIFIDCNSNTHNCSTLIIRWCRNKKRPVGSELILTMSSSVERTVFNQILSSSALALYGFVRHDDDSLRLQMDNNSEVVFRQNNDTRNFAPFYLEHANARNYLHLTVQHSQP